MDGLILSGARTLKQSVMLERAARAASGFASLGIGENGAVALVLRNDFAFFEAAMGAGLIGAYAVPVNWHFKADEAGYIIQDCGAKAVVVHADLLPQIRDGIPAGVSRLGRPDAARDPRRLRHRRRCLRHAGGRSGLGRLDRPAGTVDRAAAAEAPQHDLHIGHDRPAQGRAARARDAGDASGNVAHGVAHLRHQTR